MMCVYLGLGQSISVQAYLYAGAERDLFTEMFPEGQRRGCIWPTRKPATRILYLWRMELQEGRQSVGSLQERRQKEGDWGSAQIVREERDKQQAPTESGASFVRGWRRWAWVLRKGRRWTVLPPRDTLHWGREREGLKGPSVWLLMHQRSATAQPLSQSWCISPEP